MAVTADTEPSGIAPKLIKTVYTFGDGILHDDGRASDKTIVRSKGTNLAERAGIGLPVPPGSTITAEECVRYLTHAADFSPELREEVAKFLAHIEQVVGKTFGIRPIRSLCRCARGRGSRCRG